MERAALEGFLDRKLSLREIGSIVEKDPTTVAYWLRKHGLKATGSDRFAPKHSDLSREVLEPLVRDGRSLAEIGHAVGLSASTVRYWLTKFGLKTEPAGRRPEARQARKAGLRFTRMSCPHHGVTDFVLESSGYYRCLRCRRERVADRRRRVKQILVQEAGGRCRLCGYDRYVGALHFHHLDPSQKEFNLARKGVTISIGRLREEARKCVLVCSNCHAELEGAVTTLPAMVAPSSATSTG
jgi:transposase-like protein